MDAKYHEQNTGHTNEKLLQNLLYIDAKGKKIEIRIPFVPDHNDMDIEQIGAFLSKLKNICGVRVLPYHNFSDSKYEALGKKSKMGDIRIPTKDECKKAEDTLIRFGLPVIRF
jgi:pyruvate formate lyase activating enzyme